MSWVSLDDGFHSHPKVMAVGNAGAGLYARALSYCGDHLTDGFLTRGWARQAGGPALCKRLEESGFWITVEGGEQFTYVVDGVPYTVTIEGPGYFIPDYLCHNPTRAFVEHRKSELHLKRASAGKKGAEARWHKDGKPDGKPDGKAHGKPIANAWQTDGPIPLPLKGRSRAVTPTQALIAEALGKAPLAGEGKA